MLYRIETVFLCLNSNHNFLIIFLSRAFKLLLQDEDGVWCTYAEMLYCRGHEMYFIDGTVNNHAMKI